MIYEGKASRYGAWKGKEREGRERIGATRGNAGRKGKWGEGERDQGASCAVLAGLLAVITSWICKGEHK